MKSLRDKWNVTIYYLMFPYHPEILFATGDIEEKLKSVSTQ